MATGTARDLLIGVTVVRSDGVVAKAGGRVVKNVAGYDLGKLFIGSFGTLAVLTQAVFRLHPLPAARRVVTVAVRPAGGGAAPGAAGGARPGGARRHRGRPARRRAGHRRRPARGHRGRGRRAHRRHARGCSGPTRARQTELPPGWGAFPWAADGADRRQTALKATFALSGLARVLDAARTAADAAGVRLDLRGSGGAGVLYGALPADADAGAVGAVVDRLRAECTELGGALVVLDGPAEVKAAVDTWGPVPAIDLMRRVKERFDPERRLAPGRFVGGI